MSGQSHTGGALAVCTTDCFECGQALEGPYCPACNPLLKAAPKLYDALRAICSRRGQKVPGRPTPDQWRAALDALAAAEGRFNV
jgi:hypothetical protein